MQNRFRRGRILFPVLRCALFFVALAPLFLSGRAHAYPWLIRHGYTNCSGCHADPSGGELLTLYGHAISYEVLSTKWGGDKEAARLEEQRAVAAVARAAGAKSAPKRRAAGPKSAPKKRAAGEDMEGAEEEPAVVEEPGDVSEGEASAETEEVAVQEESAQPAAEGSPGASAEGGAEPSPFDGMSGLTGPLFGLLKPKEELLIGGSWRLASIYKLDPGEATFFPMQLDVYGQVRLFSRLRASVSLGAAKVPAGSPHARGAQVTREQGDGYNLISRTHWLGFDFGEGAHLLRVGRMNLPFGVRMPEHVMWIREKTQTDRESDQQHGVALSLSFDKARLELMAIAGNFQVGPDAFRERGYSGYVEFVVADKATAGVSSLYAQTKNDPVFLDGLSSTRSAHGAFARLAASHSVALLAEADLLTRSRREVGYVGFLQVDAEVWSGLHAIGTAELLDAGYPDKNPNAPERAPGLGEPGLGGWLSLQWFFLPHFDLRVDAIIRTEKTLLSQLHVYL